MSDFPKRGDAQAWIDEKSSEERFVGRAEDAVRVLGESDDEEQCLDRREHAKTVFVVVPPTEKNGVAKLVSVPISSEEALSNFCYVQRGSLIDRNDAIATFRTLKDGGVYTFFGAFYRAIESAAGRREVEHKMLLAESAQAVKIELGGTTHIHPRVVLFDEDGKEAMEVNAVVHVDGEGEVDLKVFILEAADSPMPREVQMLVEKTEKFKELAKADKHFRTVSEVVPVLAGRHWDSETVKAAVAAKQWRVHQRGAGYQVTRALHILARRLRK